jgi:hypothetical protein
MDRGVKGQTSVEIILLMGFLFFVFLIFLGFFNAQLAEGNDERESHLLKDVSQQIQNEVRLAYNARDGYSRNFMVPEKLNSHIEYGIAVIGDSLLTNTSKYQYVMNIPSITGAVVKGGNHIKKINGTIFVN